MNYWWLIALGVSMVGGLCFAALDIWIHPTDYVDRKTKRKALLFGVLWLVWLPAIIVTVLADPMLDRIADRVVDKIESRADSDGEVKE